MDHIKESVTTTPSFPTYFISVHGFILQIKIFYKIKKNN